MIETQILMTVLDFSVFFLGVISWKGASLFSGGGGVVFQLGGASFLSGGCPMGGISFDGVFSKKIVGWGWGPPDAPPLWETLAILCS